MKRSKILIMVTAVTVAMLLATTLPATAQATGDSLVFFPGGNGATYSCTGGPPFVFDRHSDSTGNCSVEQIGAPPAKLTCDEPTTITFMHGPYRDVEDGRLCNSGTAAA